MSIQLTFEQQIELEGSSEQPVRITNPRTNESFVLVSETEYETLRQVLDEEKKHRAIRAIGSRNAIGRMDEAGNR